MNIMAQKKQRISLADFEEMLFDRPEDEKWELIGGILVKSMVGARWEHHEIVSNVDLALRNHLLQTKKPCKVYRETFFLKQSNLDLSALPDIMVRCGERLLPDQNSVSDPIALFEIVSPGSEKRDRLDKRMAYQKLESLQYYVLVERNERLVELYVRQDDGWHGLPPLTRPVDVLRLPALDFEISLADVYRGVIDEGEPA